jgi:hypothetical protein
METLAVQEAQEAQILVEVGGQWLFPLGLQLLVALELQFCAIWERNAGRAAL